MDAGVPRHLQVRHHLRRWSTKPGFESYFHPFASMLDNLTMTQFVHNVEARVQRRRRARASEPLLHRRDASPTSIARRSRAANFPFDVWYGYHFDAVLLGQFLQQEGDRARRAVQELPRHAGHARRRTATSPRSSRDEGETIAADFFVDCTGFAGLLIQQGAEDAVRELLEQPVQRCRGRDADADRRADSLADRLDRDEARLGLEDSADQPLRQRLRLQLAVLLGRRSRDASCASTWACSIRTRRRGT